MTNLKAVFRQAAEIAEQVPETMQSAAFERALDLLVGTAEKHSKRTKTKKPSPADTSPVGRNRDSHEPRRAKSPSTKLYPKAAILWLIEVGFLDSGKTLPAMQEHLKRKRAYDLPVRQLSMALLRLVRDGKLERDANHDGQYEYRVTGSEDSS